MHFPCEISNKQRMNDLNSDPGNSHEGNYQHELPDKLYDLSVTAFILHLTKFRFKNGTVCKKYTPL
jgi:hypothetical protein